MSYAILLKTQDAWLLRTSSGGPMDGNIRQPPRSWRKYILDIEEYLETA